VERGWGVGEGERDGERDGKGRDEMEEDDHARQAAVKARMVKAVAEEVLSSSFVVGGWWVERKG